MPTGSEEVETVAVLPFRVAVPITVLPYANVTVPVGLPPNCPVTAAVKITGPSNLEGFADDVSKTAEPAFVTFWVRAADLLWA